MKLIKGICLIYLILGLCGCDARGTDFQASGVVLNVSKGSLYLELKECSNEILEDVSEVNVVLDMEYNDVGIGDVIEVTFDDIIETEPITLTEVKSIYIIEKSDIESIIDNSLKPGFACAQALELIYEDEMYSYYLSCIKSEYIIVSFRDGTVLNIKEALEKEKISMHDLDIYGIDYLVEGKGFKDSKSLSNRL